VAGCSAFDSLQTTRYPARLRYPLRQDYLVEKAPGVEKRKLPPPGDIDGHIRQARDEQGAKMYNPADLDPEDAQELRSALRVVFGTPREPRVEPAADSEERPDYDRWLGVWRRIATIRTKKTPKPTIDQALANLDLDEQVLDRGSRLYRRNCLHCHGLPGDGRGPTGPWVNPHPRDYRRGQFKFISTEALADRKPRRADLLRTLRQGIDGTSMPAFGLLPEHETEYLASYVTHLSLRGQTEFETMLALLSGGKDNLKDSSGKPLSITDFVLSTAARLRIRWAESNESDPLTPPEYAEPTTTAARHDSIRKGYQIFIGPTGCVACHSDYGRQVPYKYDEWGTLVRPANLTVGTYRGGRRPIDIYWRIKGGIPPSGMPAPSLSDADYWNLVTFVRALPYPNMLPEDVRKAVYGGSESKKPEAHARLMK
jgi:mono/diheme cytochrome c family protein